jgi:hypothetical protein
MRNIGGAVTRAGHLIRTGEAIAERVETLLHGSIASISQRRADECRSSSVWP